MTGTNAPFHAHIYYDATTRDAAAMLRADLQATPGILFTGTMTDGPVGPHPIAQFEVHFGASMRTRVIAAVQGTGLSALIHPLTDDDLADHTRLAHWVGNPVTLDLSVLDPPGVNQGTARFGHSDF